MSAGSGRSPEGSSIIYAARHAASGRAVRNFFWKGKTDNLNWDGRDDDGNVLHNGLYTYTIACTDAAGNSVREVLKGIEIDVTPTPVFITVMTG